MITLAGETEALAKRLAAAQGLSIEETVKQALEEKTRAVPELQRRRDNSPAAIAKRQANIDRIVAEIAAMPVLDPRSPQEIMDDLNSI
jgi:antitoxin VapB